MVTCLAVWVTKIQLINSFDSLYLDPFIYGKLPLLLS